ncbi:MULTISPECIES: LysR family transcriptional regulator [Lysobacter]|uniref:LysR family transcriptional regulator n=1 Tax=Lysobacter TaxID=68 RepID=UPI001F357151|nr:MULTISPECIES: LysR family transcriptional regulator [Lysobacter]UJB19161.1 LysR substrate-binding domain-containing protein [Lysobacter capsici]UJQ27114.1 LysR substrate-binding domain-containing protein [Lysobacter gummosus]
MDSLAPMRSFRRVVELGSFARAADDLALSAAGLSKQVRQLEARLGTVLLQRTTRRMSLTDGGRLYFTECCRLLDEIDALEQRMREGSERVDGLLRVNAPLSFGLCVLSPLLSRFLAEHAHLRLDLVLEDRVVDLVGEGFDVAVRLRAELEDSSLIARRLGRVEQLLCAAPDYLQRRGEPRTPQELCGHALLGYSLSQSPRAWRLQDTDGEREFALPAPRAAANNSLLLRDLLLDGHGIGSLPAFVARPQIVAGRLREVLPRHRQAPRQVHTVYATGRHLPAKVRAFLDFLAAHLPAALDGDG